MMRPAANEILDLQSFLPYRLSQLTSHVSETFAKVYQQQYQLSIPEWRILVNLAQRPASNAKELGECAAMDKSTVSRTIKILQDKHYVIKQPDPVDKRASVLSLSEQGWALYKELVPLAKEWEETLLAALTSEQYEGLMNTIETLEQRLSALK